MSKRHVHITSSVCKQGGLFKAMHVDLIDMRPVKQHVHII